MKTRVLIIALLLLGVVVSAQEAVDLGLSVKWATCNVGANAPEEYGLYFAWGDTIGYTSDTNDGHSFDWASYKWCNGSYFTITKYCSQGSLGYNGFTDDKTILEPADDAATSYWGSEWRMPTYEEWDELKTKCTWIWTTQNGLNGYSVSASNGNCIFLPAVGEREGTRTYEVDMYGNYWSSSLSIARNAYYVKFGSIDVYWYFGDRYLGHCVRPVCCNTAMGNNNVGENVELRSSATKSINNGQLVIVRKGKTYDVRGVEIK